jgi:hypothetical protein
VFVIFAFCKNTSGKKQKVMSWKLRVQSLLDRPAATFLRRILLLLLLGGGGQKFVGGRTSVSEQGLPFKI